MFGELPAYLHGWLQLLRKAAIISLLARGLGSVMVHTLGERIIRHHFLFSTIIVNEDFIGIISQFLVFSFVLCGLKVINTYLGKNLIFLHQVYRTFNFTDDLIFQCCNQDRNVAGCSIFNGCSTVLPSTEV